jgi:glycosyltransferase involved in cell wall biosynthesis
LLRRQGIEVYHAPNYMLPFFAFPRDRPGRIRCVVTIHDVIPLLFPDHAPRSRKARLFFLYRRLMMETARRADLIITVSEASRRDVIGQLAIPPERADRVVAVYNGVEPPAAAPPAAGTRPPCLLYVGRFDPYKNVPLLVRAFAALRTEAFPDLRLRLIGPPDPRYPEAGELARALGVDHAVDWAGYVSGPALDRAYREADVLVQPSRYEGFGLPVLEAMAAGTPVVCTRAGALPEVAGDAAVVVEPDDPQALASAVQRVLSDPRERSRLREAGFARVRRFTWARTAEQTLAAYRQALAIGR